MPALLRDLRYSLRALAKNRGFASVAVLTLGLGIGANTGVYSLTDQILLRALPVRRPSGLVVLRMPRPKRGRVNSDIDDGAQSFSYPFYKDLRESATCFSGLLARYPIPLSVAGQGQTERAAGELVSGNYFEVLGVRPALGRLLTPEDDGAPGGSAVAVLSHGYWTRRFGASPAVLNQSLVVNDHTLTVVGVAAAPFSGVQVGQAPDLFIPMQMKAQMTPNWDGMDHRNDYWLQMIGRLRPGVSRAGAEATLRPVVLPLLERDLAELTGLPARTRDRFLAKTMLLTPGIRGRQVLQQDAREALLLLSALVVLVLLIAFANVAGLMLARGVAHRRHPGDLPAEPGHGRAERESRSPDSGIQLRHRPPDRPGVRSDPGAARHATRPGDGAQGAGRLQGNGNRADSPAQGSRRGADRSPTVLLIPAGLFTLNLR